MYLDQVWPIDTSERSHRNQATSQSRSFTTALPAIISSSPAPRAVEVFLDVNSFLPNTALVRRCTGKIGLLSRRRQCFDFGAGRLLLRAFYLGELGHMRSRGGVGLLPVWRWLQPHVGVGHLRLRASYRVWRPRAPSPA